MTPTPSEASSQVSGIRMTGDIHRDLEAVQGRIAQVVAAISQAQEQPFEAADESGLVLATISGRGELIGLEITPKAMRDLDAAGVAAACKEAIDNARLGAAQRMASSVKEVAAFDLEEAPAALDPREAWRKALKESGWNQ
jgi:DNA-binding protein YbaB